MARIGLTIPTQKLIDGELSLKDWCVFAATGARQAHNDLLRQEERFMTDQGQIYLKGELKRVLDKLKSIAVHVREHGAEGQTKDGFMEAMEMAHQVDNLFFCIEENMKFINNAVVEPLEGKRLCPNPPCSKQCRELQKLGWVSASEVVLVGQEPVAGDCSCTLISRPAKKLKK